MVQRIKVNTCHPRSFSIAHKIKAYQIYLNYQTNNMLFVDQIIQIKQTPEKNDKHCESQTINKKQKLIS